MKFVCENCHSRYHVDDAKVAGRILRIRCKRCTHIITVRQPETPQPRLSETDQTDDAAAQTSGQSGDAGIPLPSGEKRQVDYDHLEDLHWFYSVNGRSFGPFNEDDLIAKCLSGQLGDETFVWNAGMESWRPVMEVPVFAPAIIEAISRHPQTPMLEVSDSATTGAEDDKRPGAAARLRRVDTSPPTPLWPTLSTPAAGVPSLGPKKSSATAPPVPSSARRGDAPDAGKPLSGPTPTVSQRPVSDESRDASLERLRALRERLMGSTASKSTQKKPVVPRPVTRPTPAVRSMDPWFGPTPDLGTKRPSSRDTDFSLDTRDLEAVTVESIPQPEIPASLPATREVVTPTAPIGPPEPEAPTPPPVEESDGVAAPVEPPGPETSESVAPIEPRPTEPVADLAEPTLPEITEETAPVELQPTELDVDRAAEPAQPLLSEITEEKAPVELQPTESDVGRTVEPDTDEQSAVAPAIDEAATREERDGPVTGEIEPSGAGDGDAAETEEVLFDELLFFEEGELIAQAAPVDDFSDIGDVEAVTDLGESAPQQERGRESLDRADEVAPGREMEQDSAIAQFVATKRKTRLKWVFLALAALFAAAAATILWTQYFEQSREELPPFDQPDDSSSLAVAEPVKEQATQPSIDLDVDTLNMDTTVNLARSEVERAFTHGRDLSIRAGEQLGDRSTDEATRRSRSHGRENAAETGASRESIVEGSGLPRVATNGDNSIFSELGGRTVAVEREPGRVDAEAAYQQERGHSSTLGPDYFDEDLPRVRRAVERCHGVQMRDQSGIQLERVVLDIIVQPDGSVAIDMGPDLSATTFGRCLQSRYPTWRFRSFEGDPVTLTQTYALQ